VHLQFAYYESSLVVEFLVERFSYKTLKTVLADLAKGEQINAAISRCAAPLLLCEALRRTSCRDREGIQGFCPKAFLRFDGFTV